MKDTNQWETLSRFTLGYFAVRGGLHFYMTTANTYPPKVKNHCLYFKRKTHK